MVRLVATLAASLALVVPAGAATAPELPLHGCKLLRAVDALCGRLDVPENRARPGGRTISLRVAVVPARERPRAPDPLVYLAGGPGGSAVVDGAGMLSALAGINAHRDIVLVDQRGTGGSNAIACPASGELAPTKAAVKAYVTRCLARLEADPTQYTTVPAMDDLADVIGALGYRQVNLFGGSYGATAAQYFLAQHPKLVRTAILDGGTLLDVPIFERLAPNGERALRSILRRCERTPRCASAYPRVRHEAFELIDRLRKHPVRVQGTLIDARAAAGVVQSLSRSPEGAAEIPWIAHSAITGDLRPLAIELDRTGSALGNRQVMYMSIVCNEPWARWRPQRVSAAAAGTYLAERSVTEARLVAAACEAVPKVTQPAWSHRRVRSNVPVLFVVGGDDPQDPIAHVARATRELPNGRTVVVPAGGHGSVQLGCMPQVAQAFVEHGSSRGLDTRCVRRYEPPAFVIP
jgi:pimeloyl-ACP methyl ester carboxylesterase